MIWLIQILFRLGWLCETCAAVKQRGALLHRVRVNPSCDSYGIAGLSQLTDFLDQRLKPTGASICQSVCVCVCSSVCLSGYLTECLGIWPACRASKDISSLQSDTSKRYTVEEKVVHSSVQRLLWASYEGDQVLVFQHFSSCFSRGFNYSLFYSSGQFFRLGHFLVKKYFWNVSWSLFPCCAHSYGINQIKPWLKRNL